jgi:S1-C subfamily serine protease
MKIISFRNIRFLSSLLIVLSISSAAPCENEKHIEKSIIKIISTSLIPDYYEPWNMQQIASQSGSGFVIQGERIMTNAHVVADAKYIMVQKNNDPKKYPAYIEYTGHDCDLAILKVKDKDFFKDLPVLEFTGLPQINDTVFAYGFPIGGEKVSVTKGIVSRIDYILFTHSGIDYHLAAQVDAAINPGNSGGPLIKDGKVVGVAFQSLMWAENSGYMIPYPVIERFLRDISDGKYDGYIELGFFYQELENPALRESYRLPEGKTGILITKTFGETSNGTLQEGDILLSIENYPIANDGTITIWNENLPFTEAAEIKLPGESISVTFFRKGEVHTKNITLKVFRPRIELSNSYDRQPEYIIIGGLVFMPLSRDLLKTWGKSWSDEADKQLLYYYLYYLTDDLSSQHPSFIVLTKRLPDEVNTYCENYESFVVDKVNGRSVKTLKEMKELISTLQDKFIVIDFLGFVPPIVLKREDLVQANERIMQRYNIQEAFYLEEQK